MASYKIVKNYVAKSKYSIKCPYTMSPDGITVHNTSNDAPAINEVTYMRNNSSATSFHVAVDDTQVILSIPFNRNAFHAGDGANGRGNRKTISVEICYSKSGGKKFDKAEENAAHYIATLLKQYGWTIDKVYTHKHWSGKNCPHRTLDRGWIRFKRMIQKELEILETTDYKVDKVYTLQCELNVRKGAALTYAKKLWSELTKAGQKCDKDKDGALDKGTKVICKKISKKSNGDVWIKSPSGWMKAYDASSKKVYIK